MTYIAPEPFALPRIEYRRVGAWTLVLAAVGLTLASVPLAGVLHGSQQTLAATAAPSDPASRLAWIGFYVCLTLTLLAWLDGMLDMPLRGGLVWVVATLPLVSSLWSAVPGLTAWQGVGILLSTLFAFFLAISLSARQLVGTLSWILLTIGIVGAFVALAYPDRGLDHLRGNAWSGIYSTKNEFGRIMALAAVVWALRLVTRHGRRALAWGALAFSTSMVVLSASRTGLVVVCVSLALVWLLSFIRRRPALLGPTVGAVVVVASAAAIWLEGRAVPFLAKADAEETLHGRVAIWSAVWRMIKQHFWLGYGEGAFWRGLQGPSASVWEQVGGTPPHAHNGVLDLWLSLGLVGVVLFGITAVIAARRALNAFRDGIGIESLWPLVFLVFFVLYNMTESNALVPNTVYWILYATLLFGHTSDAATFVPAQSLRVIGRAGAP